MDGSFIAKDHYPGQFRRFSYLRLHSFLGREHPTLEIEEPCEIYEIFLSTFARFLGRENLTLGIKEPCDQLWIRVSFEAFLISVCAFSGPGISHIGDYNSPGGIRGSNALARH